MEEPAYQVSTPKHRPNFRLLLIALICFAVGLFGIASLNMGLRKNGSNPSPTPIGSKVEVKKFKSDQEFKEFLQKSTASDSFGFSTRSLESLKLSPLSISEPTQGVAPDVAIDNQNSVDRVSQTNVQVQGIDEPDILKTDGKNIYYSSESPQVYYLDDIRPPLGISKPGIAPPTPIAETKIFAAFPPQSLALKGKVEKNGNLLLQNNTLVVFGFQDITGFDVTDPASPKQKWQLTLESNNQIVTSRLYNDKIYLVTRTFVDISRPCPIIPLMNGTEKLSIRCTDIYYPNINTTSDSTYTAMSIDLNNGKAVDTISFVASASNSTVYMSEKAIYIAYSYTVDTSTFVYNFFAKQGKDLLPDESLQKIQKLQTYDISSQSKLSETYYIIDRYRTSLNQDEQLKFETEMQNRISSFTQEHIRDFQFTAIVKADVNNLTLKNSGQVPGQLLNQFSLDEYQNNLRVATTVDANLLGGRGESANDTYVLDDNLKTLGSVKDMGRGERIFSVRFIEDKGYVVTYKQIDPFYVLDLSNPSKPSIEGELKLPGFSSYLDPIAKDRVLGVGQDNGQVKVTLFDVSNPKSPKELDTYQLPEYWTELSNNHHAFLKDDKYKVFFLPGGRGGYIFSYEGDKLALKKTVGGFQARRALFINDYLYVVGDYNNSKIVVLDEKAWNTVKELTL